MDQGGVGLAVRWDGERIAAARVDCRRPQAAHVLEKRPVAEAAALVPRLFSLCGRAQGAAARLALAAAQGEEVATADAAPLTREVALEAIGEHLWRLLLDWPTLLGQAPQRDSFLAWCKRLLAAKSPDDAATLGKMLGDWLPALPLPAAAEVAASGGALLPWRTAAQWAGQGMDEHFAASPGWAGLPAETGALARHADDPAVQRLLASGLRVGARLAARRADLALLARGLSQPGLLAGWLDAAPVAPGVGLARVETARGLLLHLTQVKDGRVGRYVIVAPTEWNFHPQGAFAGEIVGSPAASREAAALLARRLALALDPCVSYEVAVEDIEDA